MMRWVIIAIAMMVISFGSTAYWINQQKKIAEENLRAQNLKNSEQLESQRQASIFEQKSGEQIRKRITCMKAASIHYQEDWDQTHKDFYSYIPHNGLPVDVGNSHLSIYVDEQKRCQASFDANMRVLERAYTISQGR